MKALYEKAVMKQADSKEPSATVLGKFDRDDFDAHEDAFLNLLAHDGLATTVPTKFISKEVQ
jgi:hypothetical protein